MRHLVICLLMVMMSIGLNANGYREFGGKVDNVSPASAEIAINRVYLMFSRKQLAELCKKPYVISEYGLASWIEGNWINRDDAPLLLWFKKNGINVHSSMSLFVLRGFEFKIHNRNFSIEKELKNPSWNRIPPPLPPAPTE